MRRDNSSHGLFANRMLHLSRFSTGAKVGMLGALVGVLVSFVLLFVPLSRSATARPGEELTVVSGPTGIDYLLGVEGADPALFVWSMVILGLALVGGYGAVTEQRYLVLIVSLPLLALTLLGIASIGIFVAPVALLFLLAGVLLSNTPDSPIAG